MSVDPTVLADLKRMVMLTGRLSDVHVKTLQTAPFIFFDDLLDVVVSYDLVTTTDGLDTKRPSTVSFQLNFRETYVSDQIHDKRVESLIKTVEALLWKEVRVLITDNNGKDLINVEPS